MRTRIKFCGMTSVEDALQAASLGVDAIGLIFHPPSPRHVSLALGQEIAGCMPPFVCRVGVVVNESQATVLRILQQVSMDILQFHGQEAADFCRSFGKPYLKTIHIGDEQIIEDYDLLYPDAMGFLLDTKIINAPGGSGKVFNWHNIPKLKKPIVLAGGLTVDNIARAIAVVRPYAIDITSGIEKAKGIKDHLKMKEIISVLQDYPRPLPTEGR